MITFFFFPSTLRFFLFVYFLYFVCSRVIACEKVWYFCVMVYFGHIAISDKGVPSLWNLQKYANPQQNTCLEYKKTTKNTIYFYHWSAVIMLILFMNIHLASLTMFNLLLISLSSTHKYGCSCFPPLFPSH